MKKFIIVIITLAIIGLLHNLESIYYRKVIVINNKDNIITCVDKSGYLWEYQGEANIGDKVTLIMHDNHTSNIEDDIIKGVEK